MRKSISANKIRGLVQLRSCQKNLAAPTWQATDDLLYYLRNLWKEKITR